MRDTTFRPYVEVLLDELRTRADQTVVRYRNRSIAGDTLRREIYRYARALSALSIGRGSLVALFAPNRPDAIAIRYAANLVGAAAMYLPAPARAADRAAMLERLQPTLLVAFDETARLVPPAAGIRVVYVDASHASPRLDHLASFQIDAPMICRARADDLATLQSSGGTTGVPKASRRSFACYSKLVVGPRVDGRRRLINGPLAYLSQVLVDATLIGGGTVVFDSHYDAASTLAMIETERITDVFLVEPQLFEVMDHPDVRRRNLSSLRAVTHVGGSAPAVLRRRAIARLGPVLMHTYGASEAGLVSILMPRDYVLDPRLLDTAGRIRDGNEVRIRRANGSLAHAGEHGVIEVRSEAVASGYLHQPIESAHKFEDGWCLTGDIGVIGDDGCLRVLGRAPDIVEINGRMIGPAQIEEALCGLADVRYAVAFASGDEDAAGMSVAVEPWPGKRVDLARCKRAIAAAFGPIVSSEMRIIAMDRVPLTEQGKVDRGEVDRRIDRIHRARRDEVSCAA